MHPLLGGRRGLFYWLAWVPVSGMLLLFFRRAGGLDWSESALMAIPLSGVYAMVCLSAWYICRIAPLAAGNELRIFVTLMIASIAASLVWAGLARGLAAALAATAGFTGLEERMARNENWLAATGVLLYLLAVSLSYLLVELEAAELARTREVRAAMMARDAELKALRDQVSPHFLFNSLNSISALVGIDKQRAREMCVLLADFLRLSLSVGDRRFIAFEEELAMTRRYLAIEQVRFDQRLRIEQNVPPEALPLTVPPLILQPLVENAVKHGIAQLIEGGVIHISAILNEHDWRICIVNTYDPESPGRKGAGVGLHNVRKRLETLYGGAARLDTAAHPNEFRAELFLRKETPEGFQ
jgi:two-component system, LytTR family, sensor histidine kinase AlgZ